MMGQTAAGLLAKLNARKEQMGAPASATPAAAPSAPATGGAAALLAKMKANGVGIGNTPPAVIAAADVPRAQRTPEQQKLIDDRTAEVDASCGMPAINPPEQMSEEQFKAESAKPEPAPKAEPKGRGGRKPGSKNKPKEAPVVEETPVATEDDLVAVMGAEAAGGATLEDVEEVISRMPPPAIEKTFEPPPVIEARFKLFVDCLPMGADVVHFEEIVVDANARILASHGLADYRFAQFGQGPAIFQQTLRDMVAAGEITGNVVVSSRTPEGGLAMAPLAPLAAFPVVRGLG